MNLDEIKAGSTGTVSLQESSTVGDNGLVAKGLSPNGNGECRSTASTQPGKCSISRPALLIVHDGTLTLTNTPGPASADTSCDPLLRASSAPIDTNQLLGDKAFTVNANVTTTRSLEITDGRVPGEVGDVNVTITWAVKFEPRLSTEPSVTSIEVTAPWKARPRLSSRDVLPAVAPTSTRNVVRPDLPLYG